MTSSLKIFMLLIICLPGYHLFGSNPGEVVITEQSECVFRFDPAVNEPLNNYFVKEIARYNFLNLYTTHYKILYNLEIKVRRNSDGEYKLQAGMSDWELSGDVFYKQFELRDVLMPSTFNITLEARNGAISREIHVENLKVDDDQIHVLKPDSMYGISNPEFIIKNISFFYLETDREEFENRIALINRYLSFKELLEMNLRKAKNINPEARDSILEVFLQIYDIKRFRTAVPEIPPGVPVPEEFASAKLDDEKKLDANLRRLETLFTRTLDTINPVITQTQLERASRKLVKLQMEYFEAMEQTNHLFEPVFLETADFFGNPAEWTMLEEQLLNEVFKKTAVADLDLLHEAFRKVLYDEYIQVCDSLIETENFTRASLFARNALTFCKINPEIDCEILTFNKIAQTKYGVFDAYLRVAQSAMENNNLDFSQKYINLAADFQKVNGSFIISRETIDKSLETLAWKYLESANNFYRLNQNTEALDKYVKSQEIYEMLALDTYQDFIDIRISRCLEDAQTKIIHQE